MPSTLRVPATLLAACLALLLGAALLPAGAVAAQEPAAGDATTVEQDEELARTLASLPQVSSGARPGPDVLYASAPTSPSLENHDPRFRASTLLVSATEAYVDGEYLYTDYLYDDYGSDTSPVQPNDDAGSGEFGDPPNEGPATPNGLSPAVGDLTYPTDVDRYGGNAADLVEFRMVPGDGATAYRLTLTTLLAPDAAIVALALDTDRDAATGSSALPRDPGAPFPGTDAVLEIWGTGGAWSSWDGTRWVETPVEVATDLATNQITVTVPDAVGRLEGAVRATLALGVYDVEGDTWALPNGPSATASKPGGAGPLDPQPAGIFQLGFRFDEAVERTGTPPDTDQSLALRAKEPTRLAHEIDVDRLRAGVTDVSGVPTSGQMIRLYTSRLDLGEGRDLEVFPEYRSPCSPTRSPCRRRWTRMPRPAWC